jgi:hypothetical protein
MRNEADFRGTITYASLNAHLKLVSEPLPLPDVGSFTERRPLEFLFHDPRLPKREYTLEK